jgi:hypothetical protein
VTLYTCTIFLPKYFEHQKSIKKIHKAIKQNYKIDTKIKLKMKIKKLKDVLIGQSQFQAHQTTAVTLLSLPEHALSFLVSMVT